MRSTIFGIIGNILLAVIKGLAGFFGNSYALIADAIESTSDVFSSLIVLIGLKISTKPKDKNHPYGHGKAEPIVAIVVSLTLLGAAFTIAYQSVQEIATPHHTPAAFTLLVLVLVVAVKETLFRYVFKVGAEVQSTAVKTDAWHHRSDAITSVAAFIGISVALIFGKGYESADDWAALLASGIIAFNAYNLFRPALAEIMDEAPPENLEQDIRITAETVEGVIEVEKCFIRKMGFDYFVDLHVIVDGELTVREGHIIAHNVKDSLLKSELRIIDVLIHTEPNDTSVEQ
ncbi:MAG: cation diffusion facilitator family transporter [Ignavibacteriae bacterium]|nr:cation diffusion facilitator family transporter [Ignavibacteriota bacterium]